uniref:Uncharacterized protein n=1 Tax=Parascaris univalens TaxID=6257 RepID=A0A915BDQ2_PARUN
MGTWDSSLLSHRLRNSLVRSFKRSVPPWLN